VILLLIFILLSFLIVTLLKLIANLISERTILSREELRAYECGFECNNLSRIPFSLRYFYLTLLFLIFDLEIVFLLSIVFISYRSLFYFRQFILLLFVIVLFLGLLYE